MKDKKQAKEKKATNKAAKAAVQRARTEANKARHRKANPGAGALTLVNYTRK